MYVAIATLIGFMILAIATYLGLRNAKLSIATDKFTVKDFRFVIAMILICTLSILVIGVTAYGIKAPEALNKYIHLVEIIVAFYFGGEATKRLKGE